MRNDWWVVDQRSGSSKRSNMRNDWWVVDQRSGSSKNFGGSSKDSWVSFSRPLANKVTSIAKTMIANSNREGMGSNFSSNLSWSFNNSLHHWNMGNCSNCSW